MERYSGSVPQPRLPQFREMPSGLQGGVGAKAPGKKVRVQRALAWSQTWTPALRLISCTILGKQVNLFVSHFPRVKNMGH